MKTLLVNKSTDDTADNGLSSAIIIFLQEIILLFPKYSLWGSNPHTIISTGF